MMATGHRSTATIVATCASLGIDCSTGDTSPGGFVDLMLDEVLALPAGVERLSAILAVNDGSSVEDRHRYRQVVDELETVLGTAGWGVRGERGMWLADGHDTEAGALEAARACRERLANLDVDGVRVRLTRDVERYPHFVVEAGALGTVVEMGDPDVFAVRLDDEVPGAEEWGNEVHWINGDNPADDLELVDDEADDLAAMRAGAVAHTTDELEPRRVELDTEETVRLVEYRVGVARTFRAMTDEALEVQAATIVGGIDREELEAELERRADERRTELAYDRASGALVELGVDDATFVAESLEYLAGIDEGEHTDYDRLVALAKRIGEQVSAAEAPAS